MIDKFILRCCEVIDNFCECLANMLIEPKKKKIKNIKSPDNRMNFPKE